LQTFIVAERWSEAGGPEDESGDTDEDDQVTYDNGSDESDEDEYKTVLHKPWSALDEEEQDAALNLGALLARIDQSINQ
jgi:hypothetical protein